MEQQGSQSESGRQFALACSYVFDSWLPADPRLLREIRGQLASGRYRNDRAKLVSDLKKDFSLMIYCVRKLCEDRENESNLTPDALLETCPIDELAFILDGSTQVLQYHSLERGSEAGIRILSRALTSASTAFALSQSYGIRPNLAYVTALLRELGVALIAWNYPHVYTKVVAALRGHESLDQALAARLGFSPTLLGVTIARDWQLSPEVRFAVGDPGAADELDASSLETARALDQLCQAGEVLAYAAYPDRPGANKDWRSAMLELERRVGAVPMRAAQAVIRENFANYLRAAPELYRLPELAREADQTDPPKFAATATEQRNRYVQYCPLTVHSAFDRLYTALADGHMQRESVDMLLHEIIPDLGFARGCVYLVDPETLTLTPRLPIGETKIAELASLCYTVSSTAQNPVVSAFRSVVPLVEERDIHDGSETSFIAGALGAVKRAGVLYLELGAELIADPVANPLVYFKAVREALAHCLKLND